ncbi:unnamed protein product [Symbiodinium sp. CCMP2592]|nr:unnamed protein product [Symbiodinium sp. CCMP2592]
MEAMDGKNLDGQTLTVSKAGPKPTYRPTTDPNENFKKAMLTLQVVTGELSAPVNDLSEVLMTTQTERENVRYRKDVEKDIAFFCLLAVQAAEKLPSTQPVSKSAETKKEKPREKLTPVTAKRVAVAVALHVGELRHAMTCPDCTWQS